VADVLELLDPTPTRSESDAYLARAYCPNCAYISEPTVVQVDLGFLCASCLEEYEGMARCRCIPSKKARRVACGAWGWVCVCLSEWC